MSGKEVRIYEYDLGNGQKAIIRNDRAHHSLSKHWNYERRYTGGTKKGVRVSNSHGKVPYEYPR